MTYKYFLLIITIAVVMIFVLSKNASAQEGQDYIFLIDTSKSMVGEGGNGAEDIYEQVMDTIKLLIQEKKTGDTIEFFTFDEKTTFREIIAIRESTDKIRLSEEKFYKINFSYNPDYKPDGKYTYISRAIDSFVDREIIKNTPPQKIPILIVFTDGIEDPNPEDTNKTSSPESVAYRLKRIFPYTVFVWLGSNSPEIKSRLNRFIDPLGKNAALVFYPIPKKKDDAKKIANNITEKISIITPPKLSIEPIVVALTQKNNTTENQEILITSDKEATIQFALIGINNDFIMLNDPQKTFNLNPGLTKLSMPLTISALAPTGLYTGSLFINQYGVTLQQIPFQVNVYGIDSLSNLAKFLLILSFLFFLIPPFFLFRKKREINLVVNAADKQNSQIRENSIYVEKFSGTERNIQQSPEREIFDVSRRENKRDLYVPSEKNDVKSDVEEPYRDEE
jgi:hypothetical protein